LNPPIEVVPHAIASPPAPASHASVGLQAIKSTASSIAQTLKDAKSRSASAVPAAGSLHQF